MCCCLKQKTIRFCGNMMCFSAFLLFLFSGLLGYMAIALSGVDVLKYVPIE